ncbi:MAG: unusual protein kinase, partial [bacterium]
MVKESIRSKKQNDALENSERAAGVFMQLLALLPVEQQDIMLALIMDETRLQEPEPFRELFNAPLEHLDLEINRSEIVRLLLELIPVEQLVPPVYEKYRPMVADAANVILSHLNATRLRTKLIEQMMLPFESTLAERLMSLIAKMPTLQKLGQIIARNRNLDPKFRKLLQKLENGIKDANYESILAKVNQELKHQIKAYKVKIGGRFLAEASVCAVVPFTWYNPGDGVRRRGVFKVIKPFITGYWIEELKILEALANYLDQNRNRYGLPTI